MLDERIIALARKTAVPQLKDLEQPLASSAGGIKAKLHGYGQMYTYLMQLYEQEVGRRAQIIWRNLHRAHQSMGAPDYDGLRVDLVQAFGVELETAMEGLRPSFENDMKSAPQSAKQRIWAEKFADAGAHELARYEAEIEHYAATLDARRDRGATTVPTYVIHGNVGALVTGSGAVSNVIQNIGTDQREELLRALEQIKGVLAEAPEFPDQDRRELTEFADEAATELAKERPNTRRLTLVLQSLASAVQGIASGPGAYEVLRAAAAAIGIAV